MTLGQYINALEKADPIQEISCGLGNPHSWRGNYSEIAFEPIGKTTVRSMLSEAKECVGKTFEGYKGGRYTATLETSIQIDRYGEWTDGTLMWTLFLELLLSK